MSATAASSFPPGDLRVSDAERDRAITELTEHFQAGRITTDELEERSGLALQSRTGKELAALFADLPAGPAPQAQATAPSGDPGPPQIRRAPAIGFAIAAFAVFVTLMILASDGPRHHYLGGLAPLLAALLIVRLLARRGLRRERYHDHRHVHGQEHDRRQ